MTKKHQYQHGSDFKESANRKAAKARLICGSECHGSNGEIIDLGNGMSHCAKCPFGNLARDAAAYHMKRTGNHGPLVEVILPAPRKTIGYWRQLYIDLGLRYVELERRYEALKQQMRG